MRVVHVATAVVALLVGLGAGAFGGKLLARARGDEEKRIGKLEARIGDLETRLAHRVESLETKVDKIGTETVTAAQRADEGVRLGRGATRPARREGLADLRTSGVIRSEGHRMALIEDAQGQARFVRIGDTIADARVVEITDDAVVIQRTSGETSAITALRR